MILPGSNRLLQAPGLIHTIGLLAIGCALAGCNSIRVGPLLVKGITEAASREGEAPAEPFERHVFRHSTARREPRPPIDSDLPIRAMFGTPIVQGEPQAVQTVSAQEPVEPTPIDGHAIDLATALGIAGVENPVIAIADEAVRGRRAEEMFARSLLFPTLQAGTNLRIHRGRFLSGRGVMVDTNLQSLYYGLGADAKGGGTVAIPGVRLVGHLADALYAPRAAQQRVVQSQFAAAATRNAILLEVGMRYLDLAGAQARRDAYRQSLGELDEIVRLTANFALKKQGRESDAQRARSELLLVQAEMERAREDLEVAAAELARLLDLDPSLRLRPADVVPPLFELVDATAPLEALLAQAIGNHPEIAALGVEVQVQDIRVRQERARPWLPLVAVGFSAGEFGGGNDTGKTHLGNFSARTDLDVLAVWSLQNLGLGNHAVQNQARAQRDIADAQRIRLIDRVRREVTEAHALAQSRRQETDLARSRAETSLRSYRQEIARAKNLLARPIEVLASSNQLTAARQDLVRAMVGYSQAQLQLFTALGNNSCGAAPRQANAQNH